MNNSGIVSQCPACGAIVRFLGIFKVSVGSGIRHHCPPGTITPVQVGSLIQCECGRTVELLGADKQEWPTGGRHLCKVQAPPRPMPKSVVPVGSATHPPKPQRSSGWGAEV